MGGYGGLVLHDEREEEGNGEEWEREEEERTSKVKFRAEDKLEAGKAMIIQRCKKGVLYG